MTDGTEILNAKNIRVLVVTPTNEVKNYCWPQWIARVKNLTYKNYDVLIADNSKTRDNYKAILKQGVNCIYIKPKRKANQKYIAESHEALKNYALRMKYDFILHLESDVIPPNDIIERLLAHHKRVVSGMYFIDFGADSHLMLQTCENLGGTLKYTTNIGDGYDIGFVDGTVKEVYACGLGACLIHRSVLEKIKFRWEDGAPTHPDSFFAADLKTLGIKQYLDTGLHCNHLNSSWSKITDVHTVR